MRSPISSSRSTPSARAIRRCVPNALMSKGIRPRVGFSNSSAGPPRTNDALHDAGDLEVRIDRRRDPLEVAVAFERGQELLQIAKGHKPSMS